MNTHVLLPYTDILLIKTRIFLLLDVRACVGGQTLKFPYLYFFCLQFFSRPSPKAGRELQTALDRRRIMREDTVGLVKTNFGQQWCPCHNTELHGTVPVGEWGGAETINSHGTLKA